MLLGEFTSKKLGTFVNGSKTDFVGARKVINDSDKASHIAGLAQNWLSKLGSFESISAAEESPENPETAEEIQGIEQLMMMQIMSS